MHKMFARLSRFGGVIAAGGAAGYAYGAFSRSDLPSVSMEEVTAKESWIVIDGKVYDISEWVKEHPGGDQILREHGGRDVTLQYKTLNHSHRAERVRELLHVANVSNYSPPTGVAARVPEKEKGQRKRVVIIGAGICGASAAYFLSLHDKYDIRVIDKDWLVGGAALRSSAIMFMGPLLETRENDKISVAEWLSQLSFELMSRVHTNWENVGFRKVPMLGLIANEAEMKFAKAGFEAGKKKNPNFPDQLLNTKQLLEKEPLLSPELLGAIYKPDCCTMDPYLVCNAYAKRANANGAVFHHGIEVTDLKRTDQGFSIVCKRKAQETEDIVEADIVLLCAGWFDSELAAKLGHSVPVKAMHGQMFSTHMHGSMPDLQHILFSYEAPEYWRRTGDKSTLDSEAPHARNVHHLYGLQIGNGTLKFGGDRVIGDYGGKVFEEGLEFTRQRVGQIIPALKNCSMTGAWGGTMPFTPDQNIIVGALEPNLFVCTGAPFTKGAAAGMLLSECVSGDSTHATYLELCSPNRFKKE